MIAGLENSRLAREKQEYTQLKEMQNKQIEMSKFVVGQLTDAFNRSKTQSQKNNIASTMRAYYGALDPFLRKTLKPYINHSPISEEQEKLRRFEAMNPAPSRPGQEIRSSTKDGVTSLEQTMGDPRKYAEDYFRYSDYTRTKNKVVWNVAQDKENFLALGDTGSAAIRAKDGRITILSKEALDLKSLEDATGFTPKEIILGGGYAKTPQEYQVVEGDQLVTYDVHRKILSEVPGPAIKKVRKSTMLNPQKPLVPKEAYPSGLKEFLDGFSLEDKDIPLVKQITPLVQKEASGKLKSGTVNSLLRSSFPGYSWRIAKLDPSLPFIYDDGAGLFNLEDKNYRLIPIRGVPQYFGKDPETKKDVVLWVDENQAVYDGNNTRLAQSIEDLMQYYGGK